MSELHQIVSRQVMKWNLDRQTYIGSRLAETADQAERPAAMKPIVTISRQRGCRGNETAKLLAHELKYGFFNRQIIDYIANHVGVRSELVESLDERDRSELELWVKNLMSERVFDHDAYIHSLSELFHAVTLQGGVVIVGRGANYLMAGNNAFHVRLIAPLDTRVRNLRQAEGMSEKQALDQIHEVDESRKKFIRRYFQREINDPLGYDLIINIEKLPLHAIIKIIVSAMKARGWALDMTGGDKRKQHASATS
ncbi:MAG: hypothetical protein GC154_19845 [bacterium]|nr:hypothetical protein [bacterium]